MSLGAWLTWASSAVAFTAALRPGVRQRDPSKLLEWYCSVSLATLLQNWRLRGILPPTWGVIHKRETSSDRLPQGDC